MRVLIANDGSPGADAAADLARAVGWPPKSHLRLVAGLGSQVSGTAWTFREAQALAGSVARQLDAHLEELEQRLAREGLTVDRTLVPGRPASAIVEEARQFQADLVITGSRGHGLVQQLLLGSVAAEILDQAPCPVLVARSAEPNVVLFATDGSDASAPALDMLERWTIFERARIRVLSVANEIPQYTGLAEPNLMTEAAAFAEHQRAADAAAMRLIAAGRNAVPEVRAGDAAAGILAAAESPPAGLIVMGSRGNTGLKRLALGSVARNVVLAATTSVLVARVDAVP
jgi:nucleotide-binding universal stress UspA family protein